MFTNSESGNVISPQGKHYDAIINAMENSKTVTNNSTSVNIQYRVTEQRTEGTGWADLLPRYEPIRPAVILILLTRLLSVNILLLLFLPIISWYKLGLKSSPLSFCEYSSNDQVLWIIGINIHCLHCCLLVQPTAEEKRNLH